VPDLTYTEVTTPRGKPATVATRPGTSDLSLAGAFFHLWGNIDDEYRLASLRVDGVFVDIGAHIGLVTLAVLLDNPKATAICVEPLADNLDVLAANMDANGVAARVRMVAGAIGDGPSVTVPYGYDDSSYAHDNRYIGGLQSEAANHTSEATVPSVTLADLVEMAGGEIDTLKLDCEGCEWQALRSPALASIRRIIGEWHGHPLGKKTNGVTTLRRLIGSTHLVTDIDNKGGTGVFEAVAR